MVRRQYPAAKFQLLGFLDVKNPTAVSSAQMDEWVEEGDGYNLVPARPA